MRIEFHGAAGEVTGSAHLVHTARARVLIDCGLVQGRRNDEMRNAKPFGFDTRHLDAVVLSHAHIDHSGRLPLLFKRGYKGRVYTHHATLSLLRVMLLDSARLAESDAERENRVRARRGARPVKPLYGVKDVEPVLRRVVGMDYGERREIAPGVEICLSDAGHILGAAILELWADSRKLVFSGDLGAAGAPLMHEPTRIRHADLVLMESTYGDRMHRDRDQTILELGQVFESAAHARGNVLIPAFAVGRTQEVLFWLAKHFDEWKLGDWRIFVDSPMAIEATTVYSDHAELLDGDADDLWRSGSLTSALPNLRLVREVSESQAVNRIQHGAIVIAGSGMCNGGRIRHHLRHNLWRPECHVVFAGYQAQGTLGRSIVDGERFVKIFGERIQVRAQVHTIGGLSAHADQAGLLDWYAGFENTPPLWLVHGEARAQEALKLALDSRFRIDTRIAKTAEEVEI